MNNTKTYKDWNIKELTGYEPKTTYYMDFSIADECGGEKAIRETYRNAIVNWCDNIKYITEIYMVLNWKMWEHYETNESIAKVYYELYNRLGNYIDQTDTFTEEEKSYFYRTID